MFRTVQRITRRIALGLACAGLGIGLAGSAGAASDKWVLTDGQQAKDLELAGSQRLRQRLSSSGGRRLFPRRVLGRGEDLPHEAQRIPCHVQTVEQAGEPRPQIREDNFKYGSIDFVGNLVDIHVFYFDLRNL